MRKLTELVILTAMVLFACSCENSNGQKEKGVEKCNDSVSVQPYYEDDTEEDEEPEMFFSYQLLGEREYKKFDGDRWKEGEWVEDMGYFLDGLVICYGNSETSHYLMFNDEENYYNDYIYEWTMALKIAKTFNRVNNGIDVHDDDGDGLSLIRRNLINENRDTLYVIRHLYDSVGHIIKDYAIDGYGDTLKQGDTISRVGYCFEDGEKSICEILNFLHCFPDCINGYKNEEIKELFKKTYYDNKDVSIFLPERGYGYRKYPVDGFGNYISFEDYANYVRLFRIEEGKYAGIPGGALGICFSY